MPTITAVSLANVVAQAQAQAQAQARAAVGHVGHAGGYAMRGPVSGTDPRPQGYQMSSDQSGLNPQPLPPGKRHLGISRILDVLRTLRVQPRGPTFAAGQTYGSFGGPPVGSRAPNCNDPTTWLEGVRPANCPKVLSIHPVIPPSAPPAPPKTIPLTIPPMGTQLGAPPCAPQPCTPQPCTQQPCAPQPCSPTPCVPIQGGGGGPIGGSLGGMQVCPPCAPPIPWGWFVITSVFALLGSLQFYGKVGGGKLS